MKILALSGGKDSMACLHLMKDELACAIYVNTGFSYAETEKIIDYAKTLIEVIVIQSDRSSQNELQGIPSDVVPVDWTAFGQCIAGEKPVKIQSYLACCWENIGYPILLKAKELGASHLIYGQRNEEHRKSVSRNGDIVMGMIRVHPIEAWTTEQVLSYLATKMEIPAHFSIKHSSLDCYDCPAYEKDSVDRVAWTRTTYPELYQRYAMRKAAIHSALMEALV